MNRIRVNLKHFDWMLAAMLTLLLVFSLIALWSASYQSGGGVRNTPQYHWKQVLWIVISVSMVVVLCVPHYTVLCRFAYSGYFLFLSLIVMVRFVGVRHGGSRRWLDLKFMDFQPSEIMKIVLVITLARYLMYRENYKTIKGLIGPLLLTLVPMLLILKQPDLGTSLIFPPILFVMLYAAGAKRSHLLAITLVGLSLLPVAYFFVMKDYQRSRITAFLNPQQYSKTEGYQLLQSIDAIGSGQLLGKGIGQGSQNNLNFIPAKHNDFIFSVIGEEWGFVGCVIMLVTYLLFLLLCLGVGLRTKEPFARLTIVGISAIYAVQLFVNVGMTIGLMPITGMTLPFISYGGSSLLSSMLGVAILLNISMRQVMVLKEQQDHNIQDFTWPRKQNYNATE